MVTDGLRVEIEEGKVSFLVPRSYNRSGPGRKGDGVFYNRQMVFNRDVCISLLNAEGRDLNILDAMAGTGVRSLRMARELHVTPSITANDRSAEACDLIRENIERLSIEDITVTRQNANASMSPGVFDYIDVDPFGTPVRHIPQALMSVRSGGVIGITATDSAMLCGSAKGCERRYLAHSRRWPFMHEVGARILLGYIVRMGASYDRAVYPLLSYFSDHYFRMYVRVRNGVNRSAEQLSRIGYASFDRGTGRRSVHGYGEEGAAGPLWTGRLHDGGVLERMRVEEWFGSAVRMERMLRLWKDENEAPALFYNTDELSSRLGLSLPSLARTLEAVGRSFSASRTHFDPKGVKTDADILELRDIFRSAGWAKDISADAG